MLPPSPCRGGRDTTRRRASIGKISRWRSHRSSSTTNRRMRKMMRGDGRLLWSLPSTVQCLPLTSPVPDPTTTTIMPPPLSGWHAYIPQRQGMIVTASKKCKRIHRRQRGHFSKMGRLHCHGGGGGGVLRIDQIYFSIAAAYHHQLRMGKNLHHLRGGREGKVRRRRRRKRRRGERGGGWGEDTQTRTSPAYNSAPTQHTTGVNGCIEAQSLL